MQHVFSYFCRLPFTGQDSQSRVSIRQAQEAWISGFSIGRPYRVVHKIGESSALPMDLAQNLGPGASPQALGE